MFSNNYNSQWKCVYVQWENNKQQTEYGRFWLVEKTDSNVHLNIIKYNHFKSKQRLPRKSSGENLSLSQIWMIRVGGTRISVLSRLHICSWIQPKKYIMLKNYNMLANNWKTPILTICSCHKHVTFSDMSMHG